MCSLEMAGNTCNLMSVSCCLRKRKLISARTESEWCSVDSNTSCVVVFMLLHTQLSHCLSLFPDCLMLVGEQEAAYRGILCHELSIAGRLLQRVRSKFAGATLRSCPRTAQSQLKIAHAFYPISKLNKGVYMFHAI